MDHRAPALTGTTVRAAPAAGAGAALTAA